MSYKGFIVKKNEFFKLVGLKSDNIRSWGASNDKFQVLCCWNANVIEHNNATYVEIFDLDRGLPQTQQRKERKRHAAKANKPEQLTYILLGDGRDDDDRSYKNIDLSDTLTVGGNVIAKDNKWYIELTDEKVTVSALIP